jgi:hypothetical protein
MSLTVNPYVELPVPALETGNEQYFISSGAWPFYDASGSSRFTVR